MAVYTLATDSNVSVSTMGPGSSNLADSTLGTLRLTPGLKPSKFVSAAGVPSPGAAEGWVCFVTFICNIFDYLRVNNMPMMALVKPVYDCLFQLAQPDSLSREEEVDCLVLQLHRVGEQLETMNGQLMDELFVLFQDGFLLPTGLSSLAQLCC
ncbi:MIF4G domain-containing protein [Sciurus carolinensis]|uniref:MIF4G domain-containing protein n=1 Tax=Sciurus carolinensis TaxID=30640 RepID=A0AA41NHT9_SCICA|nr:MIF4G domain-containing protein [Sciurus carolinensis]